MQAPLPPDEPERLKLLHALDLLDTRPEPAFDRITRLVARALEVPMALVSLVDEHRQWFKSRVGVELEETPREQAFCAHAILQTEPLVVNDAGSDARFRDNPLVTGPPEVRFYAGVPIRTSGGLALGTLCALDAKPRVLTEEELATLRDLADMVSEQIQLRETVKLAQAQLQRSDAVLEASEARFRTMVEKAPVGIALVAPDGGWLSVNQALCRMLGYGADELKRMRFQDITHPDDLQRDVAEFARLRSGEIDQYRTEKRYLRKDGGPLWISLSVTRKANAGGELEYFISVVQDIHARRQAEDALRELQHQLEQRVVARTRELSAANDALVAAAALQRRTELELRTVIDSAPDAFMAIALDGRIADWNPAAERLLGWRREEALGQSVQLLLPERFRDNFHRAVQAFGGTGHFDMLNRRLERIVLDREGREVPVEVSTGLAGVEGAYFFSAFLHDISERRRMERMKTEFISTVSHELRTPMTSIRASLALLAEEMTGEMSGESRELVEIARNSAERLVRLVNDVLDMEKIEAGRMQYRMHRQPLQPLLREAIAEMRAAANQQGVALVLDCVGEVVAEVDADRMVQVLVNLLSNAIKFSPPNTRVTVTLSRQENAARIAVADQGSGIPEAFRDQVFDKFTQADATDTRRLGGTGLGLSICKSIVEEHGGSIGFGAVAGGGTEFVIILPLESKGRPT